jgi:hypothetical protein
VYTAKSRRAELRVHGKTIPMQESPELRVHGKTISTYQIAKLRVHGKTMPSNLRGHENTYAASYFEGSSLMGFRENDDVSVGHPTPLE